MSLNQSLNFLIGIEDKQTCNGFQENLCMKWLFLDIEVAASNQDAILTKLQQLLHVQP
jgi:hypothetical protein